MMAVATSVVSAEVKLTSCDVVKAVVLPKMVAFVLTVMNFATISNMRR